MPGMCKIHSRQAGQFFHALMTSRYNAKFIIIEKSYKNGGLF